MNKKYNLKLDLQFRCNNSTMKFNQFDNNTSDFFMRITNGGKLIDIEKALVVLAVIKPSGKVSSQFVEVENGLVYADLKPNMVDEIGTYTAQAMLILEDERVVTDVISYEVEEDKIFSLLNDTVETTEEFTLLTDMLNRLSTIEISEEQRMINEAERILSEENRKIEEAKRVEAELIRQHEEADRAKYDAIRESNENIRKQNESIRLANETNRIDEEAKRVEEENKRKLAEEERNANYNFMTEDEERRRSEANDHKEAEALRVQAETNRVNEEAKRRTTEQARVSAENTRVSNENTREANEVVRKNNEAKRVQAETQRQNRYNSFISDAEANANNFEDYTNSAKVKEEERKSNELDRKSQENRRVSNEVERISNENTRKANEITRESNDVTRQNTFINKVNEVDNKISEINITKDNFISSINTKVDNKISELDNAKTDMTNTVSNKINEVENRFNALTSKQQQDAEVIDARDGETSLKARLDRDIEKANKELDKIKKLEESTVSTVETESDFTTVEATTNGYFEDVKLEGKTLVNLAETLNSTYYTTNNGGVFSDNTYSSLDGGSFNGFVQKNTSMYKPNTTYTAIVNIKSNTASLGLTVVSQLGASSSIIQSSTKIANPNQTGVVVFKFTTKNSIASSDKGFNIICNGTFTGQFTIKDLIILEGDHTQNPPSYFEGLKSVGQSATTLEDGADEIVVSSVKGDGNLFNKDEPISLFSSTNNNYNKYLEVNGDYIVNKYGAYGMTTYISTNVKQLLKGTYTLSCECYIGSQDAGKSVSLGCRITDNNKLYKTINLDTYSTWHKISYTFHIDADTNIDGLMLQCGGTSTNFQNIDCRFRNIQLEKNDTCTDYKDIKQDKKRLLFYNEETQTWEKPILREWDSIEKHADGKYYYHQRSAEVVLNGSQNPTKWGTIGCFMFTSWKGLFQDDVCICDKLPFTNVSTMYGQGVMGVSCNSNGVILNVGKNTVEEMKEWLQTNNLTVLGLLKEEKVYECTNIDLITYANETNYIVECGAIAPKSILKVHNNISNVVSLLQKKVSLLESNITNYMITQNRMQLASTYSADSVTFKVDYALCSEETEEYNEDLYNLILNNILVGKDNYNYDKMFTMVLDYASWNQISWEQFDILVGLMDIQHNPPTDDEIVEEIPNEIM